MKVIKHILFWLIQCTWGVIMNAIGAIMAIGCLITGHKPHRYGYSIYFSFGSNWGGVSLGGFFFVSNNSIDTASKEHESGHCFQNLVWGPLFPFVIGIPSMIRYYLFDFKNTQQREVFSIFITVIPIIIGAIGLIVGGLFNLGWLGVPSGLLIVYAFLILNWLAKAREGEIDRMEDPKYGYYDIWFEAQASDLGKQKHLKNEQVLKYE